VTRSSHHHNTTSNARLRTRSALSRRNTISSHNHLLIYSVSKMKQASMTFSVTFEFFNLENPNVNFLWKVVVLHKPPIFHTKFNKMPMIWPQIWAPWHRKPLHQSLWKIHGFSQNLWFSIEPYQIPPIWPQIRAPWHRKPLDQFLWKIHGFFQNLWFFMEPYQIPPIWPQIRVPWCRKPFGQPLSKIHSFSQNRCFFDLCGHTSKQAIRQLISVRLFSARKRIFINKRLLIFYIHSSRFIINKLWVFFYVIY
jgi:hypothetical protein